MNARTARLSGLALVAVILMPGAALAQEIDSAHVDRDGERIIVRGNGFGGSTVLTLGGVAVPTANVAATVLDLPFGAEIYSVVDREANFALALDGGNVLSLYIDGAIEAPPPPPPPPPPGGPDCPCIAGWEASGIPKDNFTFCYYGQDGTQDYIFAQRDNWFISSAFDPNNIFFDTEDPGNSISYCVLHDGNDYTVAEPVVNSDQYSDCDNWLWLNICL
jgi:hypothetical protein